jgi:hypothetical protein
MPRNKISPKSAGVERMMSRQRGPIWRLIEDFYGERLIEVDQKLRVRVVPAALAEGRKACKSSLPPA